MMSKSRRRKAKRAASSAAERTIRNRGDVMKTAQELQREFK
jgi:hypothetical protein